MIERGPRYGERGERTYQEKRDLAEIGKISAPMLSYSGEETVGKTFSRAGIAVILGTTIVGSLVIFFAKRDLAQREALAGAEGAYSRIDPEAREASLEIADRMKAVLQPLASKSSYTYDSNTKLYKISEAEAPLLKYSLDQLQGTWPGHERSSEVRLFQKLLNDGASPKEIYAAYDGLRRRIEKRVELENKWNPMYETAPLKDVRGIEQLESQAN